MVATGAVVQAAVAGDRAAWDGFLSRRSEADVLQSWAWGEAAAMGKERVVRLLASDGDGTVVGVALALVRSAPLGRSVIYVPHGPVWDRDRPDADEILAALVNGLRERAHQERAIVIKIDPAAERRVSSAAADDDRVAEPGVARKLAALGLRSARFDLQARSTLILDLVPDPDGVKASWAWYARNRFKRSQRAGVEAEVVRSADATGVDTLSQLLAATAERGGFRARGPRFLQRLADELAPDGGWYLSVARLEGRPVAAMLGARLGPQAFYLYGGTARDEVAQKAHVGYAAMGTLMIELARDGVERFDLWGVYDERDAGADPSWQGFTRFKRQFGGRALRHPGTFDLVVDPPWFAVREWRERAVAAVGAVRRREHRGRGGSEPQGEPGTPEVDRDVGRVSA
jgi:lipid II:glycine glycyltransferase (peptidoglycan interpeptide bridge formation enzyme)